MYSLRAPRAGSADTCPEETLRQAQEPLVRAQQWETVPPGRCRCPMQGMLWPMTGVGATLPEFCYEMPQMRLFGATSPGGRRHHRHLPGTGIKFLRSLGEARARAHVWRSQPWHCSTWVTEREKLGVGGMKEWQSPCHCCAQSNRYSMSCCFPGLRASPW